MSNWNECQRAVEGAKKFIAWVLLAAAAICVLVCIWSESWQWGATGSVALVLSAVIAGTI